MDDNEYIRQLEQAAALPDWIARKKAYLRLTLLWLKPRDSCELGLLGFRRYA